MAKFKIDIANSPLDPAKPQFLQVSAKQSGTSKEVGAVVGVKEPMQTSPAPATTASVSIGPDPVLDTITINVAQAEGPVEPFGAKTNRPVFSYPNDVVRFDLFNANNVYLGTNYRVDDFRFQQTIQGQSVIVNVEQNVQQLGYLAGRYNFSWLQT